MPTLRKSTTNGIGQPAKTIGMALLTDRNAATNGLPWATTAAALPLLIMAKPLVGKLLLAALLVLLVAETAGARKQLHRVPESDFVVERASRFSVELKS